MLRIEVFGVFYFISEKVLTVSGTQFPLTLEEIKSKRVPSRAEKRG